MRLGGIGRARTVSPKVRAVLKLAAALGAIGGGVAVALLTNAIPKLMQQIETHMQAMMTHMEEKGIDTSRMCPMMASLGRSREEGVQSE